MAVEWNLERFSRILVTFFKMQIFNFLIRLYLARIQVFFRLQVPDRVGIWMNGHEVFWNQILFDNQVVAVIHRAAIALYKMIHQ